MPPLIIPAGLVLLEKEEGKTGEASAEEGEMLLVLRICRGKNDCPAHLLYSLDIPAGSLETGLSFIYLCHAFYVFLRGHELGLKSCNICH